MKRRNAKNLFLALALGTGLFSAAGANAALVSVLGGQAVYDTDLNLTWLADANLAASNTFGMTVIGAGGSMGWTTARSWIAAMNTANYLGFNDWRLPTTLQPDATCGSQVPGGFGNFTPSYSGGLNCTGSEMGHLFYNELGGVAGLSITSTHNANYSLFQNVQSGYWSGEYGPNIVTSWYFDMTNGGQYVTPVFNSLLAMAVRPGQSVAAVPEPETYAMLLAGLGLMGFTVRRKKNRAA